MWLPIVSIYILVMEEPQNSISYPWTCTVILDSAFNVNPQHGHPLCNQWLANHNPWFHVFLLFIKPQWCLKWLIVERAFIDGFMAFFFEWIFNIIISFFSMHSHMKQCCPSISFIVCGIPNPIVAWPHFQIQVVNCLYILFTFLTYFGFIICLLNLIIITYYSKCTISDHTKTTL